MLTDNEQLVQLFIHAIKSYLIIGNTAKAEEGMNLLQEFASIPEDCL